MLPTSCAQILSLLPWVREDHAAHIATWLLKNDNLVIFQIAAHAQRAVKYRHKLLPAFREAAPSWAFCHPIL